MKTGKPKIVYIITGSSFENQLRKEWIEQIHNSKKNCEISLETLNNNLKEEIERGALVAERYLIGDPRKEWNSRKFFVEDMNDEEYSSFHLYFNKRQTPFRMRAVRIK